MSALLVFPSFDAGVDDVTDVILTTGTVWTDPWDGKQKVMERRQPRARADLLPPGITAQDGKWTYVPEVKLDQGRIRAAAAAQDSISVGVVPPKPGDCGFLEVPTSKATVGCLVRIKNEVHDAWNGLIVKVEQINPNGRIYGSVEDCSASSLFSIDHFRTHRPDTYAFDKYEVIE